MGVECFGTYNGIPVYTDINAEPDKILTMNSTNGKPDPRTRVENPRTKGLNWGRVIAVIVHPSIADKLKDFIK